jgi:hypothetical protein
MLECLLVADSSDEVLSDALFKYFKKYEGSNCQDIEAAITSIEKLLKSIDNVKILSVNVLNAALLSVCRYLSGVSCITVISLLLDNYGPHSLAAFRTFIPYSNDIFCSS